MHLVDAQYKLWHNPLCKGCEENEYICVNCQRAWYGGSRSTKQVENHLGAAS